MTWWIYLGFWVWGLWLARPAGAQTGAWPDEPLAQTEVSPALLWRAGLQWQRDSNVLRSASAQASDHVAIYSAGLRLDRSDSRQRIELDAQLDAYRHQRATALDFDALNYRAAWSWGLGPLWGGQLSAQRRQWVDRLGETTASSGLLRRTESSLLAEFEYALADDWQALAGVYERRLDNTDPLGLEPDSRVRGGQLGLRYQWPSGNTLTYRFIEGQGSYAGVSPTRSPGDFNEREHSLQWAWDGGARLRMQGQVAHVDRAHEQRTELDWAGWTLRLGAQWDLSGKTLLGLGAVRDIGAYPTSQSSYFEGYRVYLAPQWQVAPKTRLRLRLEEGERLYKGAPAGAPVAQRRDRLQALAAELQWQALRSLKLGLSVQRDQRRSNQVGADYCAHVVTVSAQAEF